MLIELPKIKLGGIKAGNFLLISGLVSLSAHIFNLGIEVPLVWCFCKLGSILISG